MIAPCVVEASMLTCRTGVDSSAQYRPPARGKIAAQTTDYLRLHQEIVAPLLFLDLEHGTDSGTDRRDAIGLYPVDG